jgi:hypothetical protein
LRGEEVPVRHTSPEFSVFVRKARQAAHQALFFLYELEPLEQMLTSDRHLGADVDFARNQVRVLLDAVRLPADTPLAAATPAATQMSEGPTAYLVETDGLPTDLFRVHEDLVADDDARLLRASSQVAGFWAEHVCAPLRGVAGAPPAWTAGDLVRQLRAFCRSRARSASSTSTT